VRRIWLARRGVVLLFFPLVSRPSTGSSFRKRWRAGTPRRSKPPGRKTPRRALAKTVFERVRPALVDAVFLFFFRLVLLHHLAPYISARVPAPDARGCGQTRDVSAVIRWIRLTHGRVLVEENVGKARR